MFRGETPQSFLENLAKSNPDIKELKGLDFSNPCKAAESLCKEKGLDYNSEKNKTMEMISQFLANK